MSTIAELIILVTGMTTTIVSGSIILCNIRVYLFGFTGRKEKPYTPKEEIENFEMLVYNPVTDSYDK